MPKPILQSLILADHVYEDKLTGKRIIAGVFNRIIRGVRVVREIPPPTPAPPPYQPPPYQAPTQTPHQPPQQQPVQPQAPIHVQPTAPMQPAEPIQVHHGQSIPNQPAPAGAPAPAPYAPPAETSAPPATNQPAPAAASQQAAAPAQQPSQAPAPTPYSPPAAPPPAPPLQPPQQAQRVLEIPPTGLQSGSPFAYLSLTEVRGMTPLLLQLVNLQDDTQLFRSDLRVQCDNPLYTVELTVPLPPIAPPQAGIYALELLYNNELLGSLRIVVEDAQQ